MNKPNEQSPDHEEVDDAFDNEESSWTISGPGAAPDRKTDDEGWPVGPEEPEASDRRGQDNL